MNDNASEVWLNEINEGQKEVNKMRDVEYPLSPEMQTFCSLDVVKVSDIFKICLSAPVSKEELFQLVEIITDTDMAVAFFSSNAISAQAAKEYVFHKISKLLKKHVIDEGFETSFQVLRELYRMETEGVPVNATLLMEMSDFYIKESQRSMNSLLQAAENVGLRVSESEVRGRSFSFPVEFANLNTELAKVRKDVKHACMLKPEKLCRYLLEDSDGNSRLMTHWNIFGALSGRIQSSGFNVQGLPKKVREACIVPRAGYSLIFSDYSSEELVLIAVLTKDMELLQEIVDGVDLHKKVAAVILSKDIAKVTKTERSLAKAVVFAYLYGAGDATLKDIIAENWVDDSITVKMVKKAIHQTFPKVRDCVQQIEEQGYIRLINGQQIYLDDIPKRHTAFNRMIQGSGSVILKSVIATLTMHLPVSASICFLLHDEVVIEVVNQDVGQCVAVVTEVMTKILKKYGIDILMPISITVKEGGE